MIVKSEDTMPTAATHEALLGSKPKMLGVQQLMLGALVSLSLLQGCVSLTAAGRRVQVQSGDQEMEGCRFVGEMSAEASTTKPSPVGMDGNAAIAKKNARRRLINSAAARGADTITNIEVEWETFGATATGTAFDCRGDNRWEDDRKPVAKKEPAS